VGLLLAAGTGSRFRASAGRDDVDKLLSVLPDGRTVCAASAAALRAVVPYVLAVTRPGAPALRAALEEAGCVVLEAPQSMRGMGASLAAGARLLLGTVRESPPRACLVALADMPWIKVATLAAVRDAAGSGIVAPFHAGQRGHPVGFAWDLLPEMAQLDGDAGARALLARHGVRGVPCDDPGILRDVDTPADLSGDAA
jgi:molybdenum cofactor cytidylyltransferase